MRAIQVTSFDAPPALADLPTPEPGAGEVRLAIGACALNFADLLMVRGKYQERPALPFIPGMEVAGTVDALGEGVAGPAPGTRVAVFGGHGGLAEAGCFEAARCVPVPEAMTLTEAAAFQVAYGTAHVALEHRARLRQGETLLVLGAAGGVGLAAVEIGRLMGANVIAVARGAARLAATEAAGAHHLIDSDSADIRTQVKALGGADVVFDPVGGEQFTAALRACRPEARVIPLGFASGDIPQIPANILLVKNITVIGFYWGGYTAFRPEILRDSLTRLFAWYSEGKLHPHVSHVLDLADTNAAMDLLRARQSTGKVVLTMGG